MANTNRKPGMAKPISSHPLFPAVVALWFGALLGLGSLAIRPTLLEAVVMKIGLDLIIPAAAPPLGITARILIAITMAAAGAVLGTVLALRIGRDQGGATHRKRGLATARSAAAAGPPLWSKREPVASGPSRRPISAHEELGEALVARRRPLAVEQEDRPFAPPESAPLPGEETPRFAADAAQPRLAMPAAPLGDGPLDLGAFPAPAPVEPVVVAPQPEPWPVQPVPASPPQFTAPILAAPVAEGPVQPLPSMATAPKPEAEPQPQPAPAAAGITDLARRLQDTMNRNRAGLAAPGATQAAATAFEPAPPPATALPAEPEFVPPPRLTNLFTQTPAEIEPPFAPPPVPAHAPIPVPAALRPVSLDLADDEDSGELSRLVPRHLAMPAVAAEPAEEEDSALGETDGEQEDGFASLLQPRAQPRQEFVRIEEPEGPVAVIEPVVIFPGQMANAPAAAARPFDGPANAAAYTARPDPALDPGDAERALRLALASLQRISGAA